MTTQKYDVTDAKGWTLAQLEDWLAHRFEPIVVGQDTSTAALFRLARVAGWTFQFNGVWSAEDYCRSVRLVADDDDIYHGLVRVAVMAQVVQDEWDEEDWARC